MTKGEKTKRTVIEKSLKLFADKGFAGTSVRKIASEVGLRESAIYNYFKSKTELLKTILNEFDQSSTGLELLSDELIDQLDNPKKFMKLFSGHLIDKWSNEKEILFLKLVMKEQNREVNNTKLSISYFLDEARNIWRMIFEQMMNYKFIKKIDPELTANEFIAPLFFIRLEFLLDSKNPDKKEAIKRAYQHIDYFWETIKK